MSRSFTCDELFDLEYAVKNLIGDKKDYCPNEEGIAEAVARLARFKGCCAHPRRRPDQPTGPASRPARRPFNLKTIINSLEKHHATRKPFPQCFRYPRRQPFV